MRDAIGRYRITGRRGEGGMGLVYDAWDDRLGRPVALKMIRSGLSDERGRERFWREARAAGALSHPNICHVLDRAEGQRRAAADAFLITGGERLLGVSVR